MRVQEKRRANFRSGHNQTTAENVTTRNTNNMKRDKGPRSRTGTRAGVEARLVGNRKADRRREDEYSVWKKKSEGLETQWEPQNQVTGLCTPPSHQEMCTCFKTER